MRKKTRRLDPRLAEQIKYLESQGVKICTNPHARWGWQKDGSFKPLTAEAVRSAVRRYKP